MEIHLQLQSQNHSRNNYKLTKVQRLGRRRKTEHFTQGKRSKEEIVVLRNNIQSNLFSIICKEVDE